VHDLVYIEYIQQLAPRYNIRDEIDFILLNDIDECNEWLVGVVDDEKGEMSWFLMMISVLIGQLFMKLQVSENQ